MQADMHPGDGIAEAVLTWFSQNSPQGVLVTDDKLIVVGWNRWLATATGLNADMVLGRPLFEVIPSLVERSFDQYYVQALNGAVKVLSHSFHRFIVPTTNGRERTLVQSAQSGQVGPLVGPSGIVGTITIIDDVSDRVASETRFRERIAAAEAASRVKDEFLATLSHEIRTPLNAVLGWTRILRSRPDLDEKTIRRAVDVIDRNATAQLTLISDMLDMARISSGKMKLEMSAVDLGAIALAAAEAVRPAAEVKGVDLSTDVDARLPSISGDADRLQQVVWNLLSNSVKFTEAGGQVTLRVVGDGRHVLLTVVDTGRGIDPGFLPHVFERFKQADPSSSRRHGGLGLGLALVKELVHMQGGAVSAESGGHGAGTTMRVRFPARVDVEQRARMSAAPEMVTSRALHGIQVLVVADDRDAAEISLHTLQDAAAIVTMARSVEEALLLIRHAGEAPPQVIVTDIGLPERDGYVLLNAVRALPPDRGGAIPLIALSGYAGSTDRSRALRAGFEAYLTKPIAPAALVATVAEVIGA